MCIHTYTYTHTLLANNNISFFLNRNKAGKTVDGLYDVPRRDKLAVKTSLKEDSSSDEDLGAIYAVPRLASLSDGPDNMLNIEPRDNTAERNSVKETAAKDRSTSSHIQNSHVDKQPPVAPRKTISKSESDHTITPPVKKGEEFNMNNKTDHVHTYQW